MLNPPQRVLLVMPRESRYGIKRHPGWSPTAQHRPRFDAPPAVGCWPAPPNQCRPALRSCQPGGDGLHHTPRHADAVRPWVEALRNRLRGLRQSRRSTEDKATATRWTAWGPRLQGAKGWPEGWWRQAGRARPSGYRWHDTRGVRHGCRVPRIATCQLGISVGHLLVDRSDTFERFRRTLPRMRASGSFKPLHPARTRGCSRSGRLSPVDLAVAGRRRAAY